MATSLCPSCLQALSISDINIAEGAALCRACGTLSRLREVIDQPDLHSIKPCHGCSYEESPGTATVVRASLRSLAAAIPMLAYCVFLNVLLSIFSLHEVAGIYSYFSGRPVPAWFPEPKINSAHSGEPMELGTLLFVGIFLLPFMAVGVMASVTALLSLFGFVEVSVDASQGRVRTGMGSFAWTRRFDASTVKKIMEGQSSPMRNGHYEPVIQIESDRVVKFGSLLPEERLAWMLEILRLLLVLKTPAARRALSESASHRRVP